MFLLSPLCELLEKLAGVQGASAAAHERVSEDLRDIAERHRVIERVTSERAAAAKSLDSAKQKIIDLEEQIALARARKDFNEARFESQMAKLQAAKKAALLRARDVTVALIGQRQKFTRFAFRRLREAFTRLGESLGQTTDAELRIAAKLLEGLRQARDGAALADTAFEAVELPALARTAAPPEPAEAPAPRPPTDRLTGALLSDAAAPPAPPAVADAQAPAEEESAPPTVEAPPAVPAAVPVTARNAVLFEDALFAGITAGQAPPAGGARREPLKLQVFDVEDPPAPAAPPVPAPARFVDDEEEKPPPPPIFDLKAEGIDLPVIPDQQAPRAKPPPKKSRGRKTSPFDVI
jgi:hypothetical protein